MKKSAITRIWIIGSIVIFLGCLLGGINLALLLAYGGHFVPTQTGTGSDFVPNLDRVFWTTVSLMAVGFAFAALGVLLQAIAWIGALVNTFALADKTWFVALLASGLLGFGLPLVAFAGMIAYLVAGLPGLSNATPLSASSPAPIQGA